jgi:hypothetical protein
MTRWRVRLEYDAMHNAEQDARSRFRERDRLSEARPLEPGERSAQAPPDCHVPAQIRLSDDPVLAEWIANLKDWRLAMRVQLRLPVLEVMAREVHFDREAALTAVQRLRAGEAVETATVVRLARHRLETE